MYVNAGFSKVEVISEKLMDTVVAVSGSSPEYMYLCFIEAMADAAVEQGTKACAGFYGKICCTGSYGQRKDGFRNWKTSG